MGWVVKQWRLDTLERLLAESVQADLASTRAAADRDARRARRAADRTAAAAARELSELEQVGVELRTAVRDWRVWLRDVPVEPRSSAPAEGPAPALGPGAPPPAAPEPSAPAALPAAALPAAALPAATLPAAAPVAATVAASPAAPERPEPAAQPERAASPAAPEPPEPAAQPERAASPRRRRPTRASLHSSALTELFRATAAR